MNDAVAAAAGTPKTDNMAPTSGLLDLSRQQRNLLLLRPLFALELNKQRVGEDSALFQGVDTQYLVLSVLDRMMEGTTVSTGCTSEEVLTHLADVVAAMKPSLSKALRICSAAPCWPEQQDWPLALGVGPVSPQRRGSCVRSSPTLRWTLATPSTQR